MDVPETNDPSFGTRFALRLSSAAFAVLWSVEGLSRFRTFHNRTFDETKSPPIVVMRNEDYGRIWRLLDDKRPVELEFDIVNRSYPEGRTAYNVVEEITGRDKADEVVMLGGHLDSWHAATGSTYNAIGCSVMMEAARILTVVGV